MNVSPAGVIWLSFSRPSSILDLKQKQFNFQKKGKERKIYCLSEAEEKDYKEKGNIYLSPVSGRITTALAEKTI